MKTQHLTRRRWTALTLTLTLSGIGGFAVAQGGGQYRIQQAEYGTPGRSVDVTQRLRELARSSQSFRIANDTFGVDPDEGRVKALRITARGPDGSSRVFQYREGDIVDGARFAGWRGGNWDQGGGGRPDGGADGYRIVQALYGTGRRNVDVTGRLRELARADQTFRLGNDTFGVDPDEGRVKTLRIYARNRGGNERMFEYREGSIVDGGRFASWRGGDWGQGGRRGGWNGVPMR
ncbi:MAG TPA: hypothetical protein VNU71_12340 [Burkholderiaceae bacterium]|nr:hypothetical protein [Burkholderiaceae bacterium]